MQENIETVAGLETRFRRERTRSDRIADFIASFSGRLAFIALHLAWFVLWVLLNSGRLHWIQPFDPYPYILLNLILSCEAVLLSTFVLMKQNRESRRNDARDHLNLQIDLLAEREITKLLHMQIAICRKLGITDVSVDPEVKQMSEDTPVDKLAAELKEKITEHQN